MKYRSSTPLLLLAVLVLAAALAGCSTRKNTAATRQYQAFITRYNIYYNGDTHFKETLHDMESRYEDDYSRILPMHPAEAKADPKAPQPTGDFNRSIEKAQKAIQLRSIKKRPARKGGRSSDPAYKAWMKRDEYNPFLHNAWMMMGRSQYFNGDFLGAASTFFYVSRHFSWLPATVTEAKLWQARSYVALSWLFEAEMIITRIKPDQLTNNTLKGLYNFTYADFLIHSDEYAKAIPYLREAIGYASGPQKTRLNFLLGQVYSRLDMKNEAYQAYKKAGSAGSATYRTKFNARIKQSEVYTGSDIEPEVKALRRMVRYDRNKEYLDQVYYAIGNLYLSRRDTNRAVENYRLAAEKSTRNGIDKAIALITLGNIYFTRHQYDLAQPCYAEAVPQLPDNYPDYLTLRKRSDVLDELGVYSQNVTLQDSLLRLSAMSPEKRLEVVNKLIEELKKKEKEEAEQARREEYLANQAAQGNQLQGNAAQAPNSFNINADNSWYFYNTATRNAGKTEFQKRWGSRKLEDDWRRRNKAIFNTDDFDSSTDDSDSPEGDSTQPSDSVVTEIDAEAAKKADDPHFPEYYLKQIPETPEEKATANEIIQDGLYNMGVILKDKLEDYGAAMSEFDRLLRDYPDNTYRLDVYYNIYLMMMRQGRVAEAERYRNLILTDFADSKYGVAMRDPAYLDNLRTMDARQQELYERTYQAYLDNRNAEVHDAYDTMNRQYPLSKIMPKFMFLHALAYATEQRPDEFNATLREMLERYPDTDIAPVASAWLKGMAKGRKLHTSGAGNLRGMIWDIALSNDSTATASDAPLEFDLNPDTRQLLVLVYPTDEVSTNELLYDVARHNFRSFVVKDFDLEPMNFGRLGMIIIKGFDSVAEVDHYRKVLVGSDFRLPRQVRPIIISEANFDALMRNGRSFDDYFRYLEEQSYHDVQVPLLDESEIEQLREPAPAPGTEPAPRPEAEANPAPGDDTEADTEAEADAEVEPEPARAPQPEPEPKQQPKPQTAPTAKPAPKPTPKPQTKPAPKPQLPIYAPGSEGDDDPLLD